MTQAILHGLCGFYLQLLPCAFYCFYPFYDSFRYSRRVVFGSAGSIMAVMSAIFTYVYVQLDIPSGEYANYLPLNLIFLLTLGLLLACYILCIRAWLLQKLFVFIVVMNYGFLVTMTINQLAPFFPRRQDYMYSDIVLILHVLVNLILCYPMMDVLRHARRAFRSQIDPGIWRGIVSIPGVFIFCLLVFYEIPTSAGVPGSDVLHVFTKIMMLLVLFVCSISFRTLESAKRRAEESVALKTMVENYRSMAEISDKVKEARHEFNHHIAALSILLQNKDYEGAEKYLARFSRVTVNTAVSYTPHILLNAMLLEYRKRAEAAGVRYQYSIHVPSASLSIEDVDLCQFLSNLLDNALDANSRFLPEKRQLTLTIRQKDKFLFFSCQNPCDASLIRTDAGGGFRTTKAGSAHGYGIPIMKRIAEKYNGILRVSAQDGIFTATANLCLHQTARKEL